jgi:arginine/lysine/ornithine decarboxylase
MFPDRAEVFLNDADAEFRVRKSLAPLARHRPDPYEVLEIKMICDNQEEFERQFSTNVFVQRNRIELISQMSNFSVGERKNQAIQSAGTSAM